MVCQKGAGRMQSVSQRFPYLMGCALLVACAATSQAPDSAPRVAVGNPVDTVCFTSGISGFSEVDDRTLLIQRSPGEEYHVRTGFCPNLKSAEGLKIDDPGQCLSRGSRLLVYDTPMPLKNTSSDDPDRCLVTEIRQLPEVR